MDADIVGLVELENNAHASLHEIVDGLNALPDAATYDFVATGTIGDDGIKVGLIFQVDSVTPHGRFSILNTSVDARFDDRRHRPCPRAAV